MWLYLPYPAALYLSSCPLPLSCTTLPHCSVSFIFPTSLLSLPPFFLLPLFPFSHPPQHDITLALTHYQCRKPLLSYVPRWGLIMCGHRWTLSRWRYSVERGCRGEAALQERRIGAIVQAEILVYCVRAGGSQWCLRGLLKKLRLKSNLRCVFCLLPRVRLSKIRTADQCKHCGFPGVKPWEPPSSESKEKARI